MLRPTPFGIYLKEQRTAAEKSLREVAVALSLTHVYLGEIERGKRRALPEVYWSRLVKALPGVDRTRLKDLELRSKLIQIDPGEFDDRKRELLVRFALRLGSLREHEVDALMQILVGE